MTKFDNYTLIIIGIILAFLFNKIQEPYIALCLMIYFICIKLARILYIMENKP
jgi:hypothetical protein